MDCTVETKSRVAFQSEDSNATRDSMFLKIHVGNAIEMKLAAREILGISMHITNTNLEKLDLCH